MRIIECTLERLREASEFAYARNKFEAYRCRPFSLTETLEQIEESYENCINREYHEVLLQYENDKLVGVTGVYWMVEDKYLSISRGIFAEGDYFNIADGFMDYLKSKFKGYKLYINTAKEHKKSLEFYNMNKFEMLEDAVLYDLYDFSDGRMIGEIEEINNGNRDSIFNYLETVMTEDTYWNIERLSKNLSKFIVLGYFDSGIKGALYAQIYKDNSVEIFAILSETSNVKRSLLNALTYVCDKIKSNRLILYTEDKEEVEMAVEMGYQYYDSNVCFLKEM